MAALLLGCGSGSLPRASAPVLTDSLAKCRVSASYSNPVVTEWPASEKANLEARLRDGGVAVAYSGCSMRVLPQCRVKGTYAWQRTTPATDVMEIENEDELYAKLPLGAVSLEGELKSSGKLAVQTTVAGQFRLQGYAPPEVGLGDCQGATHVLTSLSVGAFELKSGGALSTSGGATVAVIGQAHAGTHSSETVLRRAGDADHCGDSTGETPASACASPIQMFLTPLPGAVREGPPGTMRVDFFAAQAGSTWQITADDHALCATPCTKWIDPKTPLRMQALVGHEVKGSKFDLPDLRELGPEGPLEIRAHSTSKGLLATGITFTSLGGVAVITGVSLTAAGCGDRPDMCKGGLLTIGAGALVAAGSIWLTTLAGAHPDVRKTEMTSIDAARSF